MKKPENIDRLLERNTKAFIAMGKTKFNPSLWRKYKAASDVFWDTEEKMENARKQLKASRNKEKK